MLRRVAAVSVLIALASLASAEPDSKPSSNQLSRIAKWIENLDSQSFHAREEATRQLIEHCQFAAPRLSKIVQADGCSPEVMRRSLEILVAGSAAKDDATSDASLRELMTFSRSKNKRLATMAENAMQGWREKVRKRKIDAIQAMGGSVSENPDDDTSYTLYPVGPAKSRGRKELAESFDRELEKQRLASQKAEAIAKQLGVNAEKPKTATLKAEHTLALPRPTVAISRIELMSVDGPLVIADAFIEVSGLGSTNSSQVPLTITIGEAWSGGDEGVAALADLDDVQTLHLRNVKLTSAAVRHIVQIKSLKSLQIVRGEIEAAAFRALRKVRPDIYVFATGEGYMGVNGSGGTEEGFLVTNSESIGGAYQAGIRDGDIIATINEIPVKDLGDVSLFVFNRKGGYPFRVELIRDGEKRVVEGKIGQR